MTRLSTNGGYAAVEVSSALEWQSLGALPRRIRNYLIEECPEDLSAESVLELWLGYVGSEAEFINALDAVTVAALNEDRAKAGLPRITFYRPIRRRVLARKSLLPSAFQP